MSNANDNELSEINADLIEAESFDAGSIKFGTKGIEADDDYVADFREHIAGLNLRYFTADEFLFLGGTHYGNGVCGGKNAPPPRSLWGNINKTALVLDEFRHRLGAAVRLTSIYRNAAYNSCLDETATSSFHMKFMATDLKAASGSPSDWRKIVLQMRDEEALFEGGVGLYRTFLHVDTRGYNADWDKT